MSGLDTPPGSAISAFLREVRTAIGVTPSIVLLVDRPNDCRYLLRSTHQVLQKSLRRVASSLVLLRSIC